MLTTIVRFFKTYKSVPFKLLFCFILSCDTPTDRRRSIGAITTTEPRNEDSSISFRQNNSPLETSSDSFVSSTYTQNSGDDLLPNQTADGLALPHEFSHCNQNYSNSHNLIGLFNICRSTQTPNKIYFQTKTANTDYQLCFFPTSVDGSGGVIMIGDRKCLFEGRTTPEYIEFQVNRKGFEEEVFSGVMIVKNSPYGEITPYHTDPYNLPTYAQAFEDCMIFLYNTGDHLACQRFKQKGQYVYIQF